MIIFSKLIRFYNNSSLQNFMSTLNIQLQKLQVKIIHCKHCILSQFLEYILLLHFKNGYKFQTFTVNIIQLIISNLRYISYSNIISKISMLYIMKLTILEKVKSQIPCQKIKN